MILQKFNSKFELLRAMDSYAGSPNVMDLKLLYKIMPKSRIHLTNRALVAYYGNVTSVFLPKDYITVQILIDLHMEGICNEDWNPDPNSAS